MSAWVALLIVIAGSVTVLVCVALIALAALRRLRWHDSITPLTEREVAQLLRPHADVTFSPMSPPVGDTEEERHE